MGSTRIAKNEGKRRSDMGYFDSVFKSLGPLRFQEIDWKKQGYTSLNSASTSFRAAAKKRNVSGVCVKTINDKLYVYSSDFLGVMPYEIADINTAFKRANICLSKCPEIEAWPIPEWLFPTDDGLSRFQIAMKLRDDLKAKYPYLSITAYGKDGYAINRDKSYGDLCVDETSKEVQEIPVIEEAVEDISEPEVNTMDVVKMPMVQHVLPKIPYYMATELAKYFCNEGYEVSIELQYFSKDETYGIITYA